MCANHYRCLSRLRLVFPELCGKTWDHKTTFPLGDDHTTVDIFTNMTSDFYSK